MASGEGRGRSGWASTPLLFLLILLNIWFTTNHPLFVFIAHNWQLKRKNDSLSGGIRKNILVVKAAPRIFHPKAQARRKSTLADNANGGLLSASASGLRIQ